MTSEISRARWRKASSSNGNGGACVEVAITAGVVGVRDTKNRAGATLTFGRRHWNCFVTTFKD